MTVLLDTDVVVDALRGRPPDVRRRLRGMSPGEVSLSTITVAELWYGAEKSANPQGTRELFEQFIEPFEILAFDRPAAEHHGRLRHALRQNPIGDRDLLIAAIAFANGLTIATRNTREFGRVEGLTVEDWNP